MSADVMEQMRNSFRAEALDLLIELDSALLALETEPGDSELVNRVFRSIHTLKGSGATAGFTHLAAFAHTIEAVFDLARDGRLAVTSEMIDCGLKACDVIRLIIEGAADGPAVCGEAEVTEAFTRLLPAAEPAVATTSPQSKPGAETRAAFEIVFRPNREIFYSGADPVTVLDDLRELGQAHITAHAEHVPELALLEAENCYLWWEILLITSRDTAAIREVFVFVEDECEVRIRLLEDQGGTVALLGSVPAEAFDLFKSECEDHLEQIETDALALEEQPESRDHLDSLFRGIHSIKGNAGVLLGHVSHGGLLASHPLHLLFRVAHSLESVLDPFRAASAGLVTPSAIQIALEACDVIRTLLGSLTHNGAGGPISPDLLSRLGIETTVACEREAPDGREAAFRNTASQCMEMIASCLGRLQEDGEFAAPVLQTYGRGLRTLSAAAQYSNCPELQEPIGRQLRILDAAIRAGETLSGDDRSVLGKAFHATRSALERISPDGRAVHVDVTAFAEPAVPDSSLAGCAIALPAVAQPVVADFSPNETAAPAHAAPASAERPGATSPSTIRIDQSKLDRLMRVVGELLVARGAFPLLAQKMNEGADRTAMVKELKEAGSNISRLADELQTSVMSIRMLPVKTVFQKFPRLVRDLSRSLGKEVRLVLEGEGIELDKAILEQIGDPLVHVIRNAVDHGIEASEVRRAKGKDSCGQVTLRARHEAGGVAIEITDDGRGLDASALKRKAIDKGLLTPEAAAGMSDESAFQLVFLPGLSTAMKLTDISGRGVGMDVVRSNVRSLQGTVEIRSTWGAGSTFLMKLPTSLMVSKGILLEAGTQEYILPLSNIRDMVKLPREATHEYQGLTLAQVRGTIYPVFHLAKMLGLVPLQTPELSVGIVEAGTVKYGLVVDRFLTEVEVLVKPLTGGLKECKEFQGAAIMGDGRVVLVLNALECHSLDRTEGN